MNGKFLIINAEDSSLSFLLYNIVKLEDTASNGIEVFRDNQSDIIFTP